MITCGDGDGFADAIWSSFEQVSVVLYANDGFFLSSPDTGTTCPVAVTAIGTVGRLVGLLSPAF